MTVQYILRQVGDTTWIRSQVGGPIVRKVGDPKVREVADPQVKQVGDPIECEGRLATP